MNDEWNDNMIGDDELDQLLGNVDCPAELKDQLLKIAQADRVEPQSVAAWVLPAGTKNGPKTRNRKNRLVFVTAIATLAATLIFVLLSVNWTTNGDQPSIAQQSPITKPTPADDFDIDSARHEIEILKRKLEVAEIESMTFDRQSIPTTEYSVDQRLHDYIAVVNLVGGKVLHEQGGGADSVRNTLSNLIDRYPETNAAKQAALFLREKLLTP